MVKDHSFQNQKSSAACSLYCLLLLAYLIPFSLFLADRRSFTLLTSDAHKVAFSSIFRFSTDLPKHPKSAKVHTSHELCWVTINRGSTATRFALSWSLTGTSKGDPPICSLYLQSTHPLAHLCSSQQSPFHITCSFRLLSCVFPWNGKWWWHC